MNVITLHSKKKLVKSENDLFHHPASILLQPTSYSDGNKSLKTLYEALVCGFKMTIMAPTRWQHSQHNCLESMRDLDVSQAKESGNTLSGKVNTLFIPSAIFTTFSKSPIMKCVLPVISMRDQNTEKDISHKYTISSSVKEALSAQMEELLENKKRRCGAKYLHWERDECAYCAYCPHNTSSFRSILFLQNNTQLNDLFK